MDGGHCIVNATTREQLQCSNDAINTFNNTMRWQIWMGNALLLTSPGIIGVLVGIGGYGQRYRYHPFTRFIFLGANTLFLPTLSYVVSTLGDNSNDYVSSVDNECTTPILAALCHSNFHPCIVITWAFLVQIATINTTPVLAINPREGRNVGPSLELLVKVIWTFYLGASITKSRFLNAIFGVLHGKDRMPSSTVSICARIMFAPFVLICAKILCKYFSFEKARLSFELGRNPGLIFGYMKQLERQERSQTGESVPSVVGEDAPPPLLVMGEDRRPVVNQPCGYAFTNGSGTMGIGTTGLVTLDKIWQLDNVHPMMPRLKDLCLSFALFKLLRCRFAGYKITNVHSVRMLKFFCSLLLKDGGHDRVFRVVADELSFVHDYYYSSLSISYTKCWLPILVVFLSLLSISYCIVAACFIVVLAAKENRNGYSRQIHCKFWCTNVQEVSMRRHENFGSLYFDVVPVFFLLALVLISEVRVMASYICSSWSKVALICHHVNSTSSQHPLRMNRWVASLLLKCRLKMMNHWDETIRQCSVLVLHPRPILFDLIRHILRLPDQERKVKVPAAVKICIFDVLRKSNSNECQLSNGTTSLRRSQVGESFLWACNSMGTSDIILTWHIATSILEVRHPYRHDQEEGSSTLCNQHKIAATHLSRYCTYLVTWCPELLPDEDEWSKSLYNAVKEEATRLLAVRAATGPLTLEVEYQDLVQLLSEDSKHEVLKNGVRLGKQLVEMVEGEEAAWAMLASFWAEMILYVAPSKNLRGHSMAIARGGELITFLWALLFHVGIVSRPGEPDFTATAAGVV